MSPEILNEHKLINIEKSNIFSIGILILRTIQLFDINDLIGFNRN